MTALPAILHVKESVAPEQMRALTSRAKFAKMAAAVTAPRLVTLQASRWS